MKNNITLKILFIGIFIFLSLGTIQAAEDNDLFLDTMEGADMDLLNDPTVKRARTVKVNFDILSSNQNDINEDSKGTILNLPLFYDIEYTAVLSKVKINSRGRFEWQGYIAGIDYSEVIFVYKDNILIGNISASGQLFRIKYSGDGFHIINEIDQSKFPECETDELVVNSQTESDDIGNDDGTSIDVMVVYTAAARTTAGGASAMEASIDAAVIQVNNGYANSGITQRINLVHTEEIVYSEGSLDSQKMLYDLAYIGSPYEAMNNVHTLRDTYGADLVHLIQNVHCGRGFISSSAATGFSISNNSCAFTNNTFAHEMGHNMSARHDRFVDPTQGSPYEHNHGYFYGTSWRTIMAYGNGCSYCTRLNYWSNPAVTYGGIPMGVSGGDPVGADNHLTLNKTANTVANFRQHVSPVTITVTSPAGGESWGKGSTYNVIWDKNGAQHANVKLRLYQNGIKILGISDSTANDGSYSWTIPDSISNNTNYIVRVKTLDNLVYDDSDEFTITDVVATITMTSPGSGVTWNKDTLYTITWDKTGTQNANVKIRLYQNGSKILGISDSTPNDGSYSWTIPVIISNDTNYIIRVKTLDNLVYDDSDEFTISDGGSATIIMTSPGSGVTWNKGSLYTITWDKTGTQNANVKIRLYQNGLKILGISDSTPNDGSYSWTIPVIISNDTNYIVRVKTLDNLVYDDSDEVTIRDAGSSLIVTTPGSGVAWTKGSQYTITWDKTGTQNANVKIRLYQNGSKILGITDSTLNDGSYTWTIPGTLSNASNYVIRIKTIDNLVYDDSNVLIID